MKIIQKTVSTLFLLGAFSALSAQDDLLNVPLPADGLRYPDHEALRLHWPETFGEGRVCLWGDDKFAALSITIDDNNAPDIPYWQELSKEFGWKFTWFIIVHPMMWDIYNDVPGNNTGYFGTALDYKPLLEAGHEIELHGSCKAMNSLSAEEYEEHALLSIKHLEGQLGHNITTYAYPCGKVDNGDGSKDYANVLSKHLIAARGTQGGPTPPHLVDYMNTKSMGAIGTRKPEADQMWFDRIVEDSRPIKYSAYRGWGVILYHGMRKPENREGVRTAFAKIKANEDMYWIKPFSQVARYAQERETSELTIDSASSREIKFSLTDKMQDKIFNEPLTVKIRVDNWKGAAAQQAGHLVPTRMVEHDGVNYVLVNAVPDAGEVVLREAS